MDPQPEPSQKAYGYGKRPLWQWIVLYLIIGGIAYGLVYYFVFAKGGSYSYGASATAPATAPAANSAQDTWAQ